MKINKFKTQRQMPKAKEITSNKLYTDILYAHLQVNAIIQEDKEKFISKDFVNFSRLSNELGMSRQTVSKKFHNLLDCGLVEKSKKGYILRELDRAEAFLVPKDVLNLLISTLQERVISIYIYLLNRYIANQENNYDITLGVLKSYVGLTNNTQGNDYLITAALEILRRLGLIEYELKYKKDWNRKQYTILKASNTLPD